MRRTEIVTADILSRAIEVIKAGEALVASISNDLVHKVLRVHKENCHRKNIGDKLQEIGIKISQAICNKICRKCNTCQLQTVKLGKKASMVRTEEPGEMVGIYLLEITKSKRIVVIIDNFTRKLLQEQ